MQVAIVPLNAMLRLLGARILTVSTFRYATHILLQLLQLRCCSVLALLHLGCISNRGVQSAAYCCADHISIASSPATLSSRVPLQLHACISTASCLFC